MKNSKYPGAISLTYATMFLEGALNVVLVVFMMTFASIFGKGSAEIALLVSFKSVGTMVTLYLAGTLSDKFGRKGIMVVGVMLFMAFLLGFIFVRDFNLLLLFSLLGGIGHGLTDSPGISLIFDAVEGNTGPMMSLVQVFFAGGGVVATLLASFFINNLIPYQYFFVIFFVLTVMLLLMTLKVRFPKIKNNEPEFKVEEKQQIKKNPMKAMVILMVCILFSATFHVIMTTWTPTFAVDIKHTTEAQGVSILSAFQIGSVAGSFALAYLLRKFEMTLFMIINPLIACVFMVAFIFSNTPTMLFLTLFLIGFFQGVYFSFGINMGGMMYQKNAGAATGAIGTINMLGFSVMISVSGWFVTHIGVNELMISTIFVGIGLSLIAILFRNQFNKLRG